MQNKKRTAALMAVAVFGGMVIGQALPARAQLGDVLKGGAIVLVVSKFGPQIDRFINQLTGNKANGVDEATKVVPIVSLGKGAYLGAVQVSGTKDNVDRVKAVAQVEGSTKLGGEIRVRALIPISTEKANDLSSLSRVKGVGVSALVDLRL